MKFEPVLMKHANVPGGASLEVYKADGGYAGAEKALQMPGDELVGLVKQANLRGRGGAGFPAGVKWGFLPPDREVTYLCVNADESEPPTFCNRITMETDPHMLLEGILIAGYATRTTIAYIYMRGEFTEQFHVLQRAIDEAYAAGYFGKNILGSGYDLEVLHPSRSRGVRLRRGDRPDREPRGQARLAADQAAVPGGRGCVPQADGGEQRRDAGVPAAHPDAWAGLVEQPRNGEQQGPEDVLRQRPGEPARLLRGAAGLPLRELIYGDDFGGGMRDGKKVKAVFPGGLSMGVLRGDMFPKKPGRRRPEQDFDELDCRLDFDDVRGTGCWGWGPRRR
jgi:NADH-quinone oxidoreductase subunit F